MRNFELFMSCFCIFFISNAVCVYVLCFYDSESDSPSNIWQAALTLSPYKVLISTFHATSTNNFLATTF